jgi:hypothetical protein
MRLILAAALLAAGLPTSAGDPVVLKADGKEVARYNLAKPAGTKLSVESGCFFHPLLSPKGVTVTDLAPDDHRHHRGIFLAWVEMHGAKDADFWGWGEHAPKDRRVIVNREVAGVSEGAFTARNEWVAEDTVVVKEELKASAAAKAGANVLDLVYALTPEADLTLAQWAFSGFVTRVRKEGKVSISDAQGEVKLPAPKHTDPKSDWPAAPWYAYTFRLDDGTVAGAAVIDHPKNPPSLWHNMTGIGMLNPCIVAHGKVVLKAKEPLVLRYRVVAYDGEAPKDLLNTLADDWRK